MSKFARAAALTSTSPTRGRFAIRAFARAVVIAAAAALAIPSAASALRLETVGHFDRPLSVVSDPGDPDRLLVAERAGIIHVADGAGGFEPFADLTEWVLCCESEQGISSILPAPDFGTTGRFYAAYSGKEAAGGDAGDFHLDAFVADPGGGLEPTREQILSFSHTENPNHYGGQLQFGPDGHLYVSTGDGGGGDDPGENALDLESPLGKILRIDPRPGEDPPYVVPEGNPYLGGPGLDEIWSYGLRNPWRISFDRASGDLVIADVGQNEREEVNVAHSPAPGEVGGAGANYGWDCREGFIAHLDPDDTPPCASFDPSSFTDPVFDYPHVEPGPGVVCGGSISGGYVIRDPALAEAQGRYVYADYCVGEIRSLVLPAAPGGAATDDRSEGLEVERPVAFGEDAAGRLYLASFRGGPENKGTVYRLIPGDPPPAAPAPPASTPPPPADKAPRVSIRRASSARAPGRIVLVVRVHPCAGNAGRKVVLKRGGRALRSKRLSAGCVARFSLPRMSGTFRALLRVRGLEARSNRLRVPRARAQRSQVLTIAFAKPTP